MGPWQDRYQTPTADALLAALPPEALALARQALKHLGRKPKPVWIDPWNWTLQFDLPAGPAYLIPDPGSLKIAARVPRARLENDDLSSLAKPARDPIVAASSVGDGVWIEWLLASAAAADAVLPVVRPD